MTAEDNTSAFAEVLAQVLGVSASEVTDATSPETTPAWDSFNALMLVSEIEKKFTCQFNASEMSSIRNVGDIKKVMRVKGIII